MPCPHCFSNDYRSGGFCCAKCHAAYMAEQRRKWSMPGTARPGPEPKATPPSAYIGAYRSPPGSPDYTWASDESFGGWSIVVRAYEEVYDR